jgi:hydrogenase maturation factor HypF (carbamoyltransferase family)
MDTVAKHIVFSGRVQGVGFRFTALNIANRYRLTGHVRNLSNGAVDNCIRDLQDSFAGCINQTDVEIVILDSNLTDFRITF